MTDGRVSAGESARPNPGSAPGDQAADGSLAEPTLSNWRRMRMRWTATRARIRSENARSNSWIDLADDLAVRLFEPLYSVSFLLYLFTGVVLLGGISIWLEIVRHAIELQSYVPKAGLKPPSLSGVVTAMHTFYPALAWSATMQIVYADQDKTDKRVKAFALTLGSLTLLMAVIAMAMAAVWLSITSIVVGIVGILLAILLWWIANAKDANLRDTLPQNLGMGAKGGAVEPSTPLPGSTQGFDFGGKP